jgi:ABC-2 type transport system permease protein
MNGFKTLLSKEWREQFRTFRLLIVSGIFLFFGLLTPVMIKYLPEIIKLAGEDLGTIELPLPTALQALTEYSATALQMGLLVAVLVTMGAIAAERRSGTAAMTLSKPVGNGAFVTAKMLAISFSFIIGLVLGGIGAYGYTWLLLYQCDTDFFLRVQKFPGRRWRSYRGFTGRSRPGCRALGRPGHARLIDQLGQPSGGR